MKISRFKKSLENYGINSNVFDLEKKKLSKKFKKEVSDGDVIWALLNYILIKNINDFHKVKMIYYEMALFLNEEGKNHYDSLLQSNKFELLLFQKQGIKKVKILSTKGCQECIKMNGNIYDISNALNKMPLPCKKCSYNLCNKKYGFCRCNWLAVLD